MISAIEQEVLHEIAMSIGNSLDMEKMLEESLSILTRKLGCTVSTVLLKKDESSPFKPVITLPLRAADNAYLTEAIQTAVSSVDAKQPLHYPLTDTHAGLIHYGWLFNDNGLLIIGRGTPLSLPLFREMQPLVDKLGYAITACQQYLDLDLVQNELKNERSLLDKLLSNLSTAILVEDEEGKIRHINQCFIDAFGLNDNIPFIYSYRSIQTRLISRCFESPEVFIERTKAEMENHSVSLNQEFALTNGRIFERDYTPFEISAGKPGHLWQYRDITERKLAEKRLKDSQLKMEHLAHHDALTNLPNRFQLEPLMQQALQYADRHNRLVAFCFLDIDNFKQINDQHGHEIGDQLLIETGYRLLDTTRDTDTVARLGGDEFVILLSDLANMDEIQHALERILTTVSRPCNIKHLELSVTASIGVTIYPFDKTDIDSLLRHADQAMYTVKQSGRNHYHLFDVTKDQKKGKHQRELDRLRQALNNDEFELFYQPKVNMRSGKVFGAEALIRWRHPENGLLPPGSFLPLVESDRKLNDAVGNWVILNALIQMQQWSTIGLNLQISINISATQLQADNFIPDITGILQAFPQDLAHRLEIEILETASIENPERMRNTLEECEQLGLKSSLDDFGTGYSSLSYLKQLPVHTIKIDRSFVNDLLHDPEDFSIVDGVIRLASAFNNEIIAEGVENAEQGIMLMRLGCDNAQGYFISRPMPASELAKWVEQYQLPEEWVELAEDDSLNLLTP